MQFQSQYKLHTKWIGKIYKLLFIDSFQFLSCSLNSLVKNLCKNDLKLLNQELDTNVLD